MVVHYVSTTLFPRFPDGLRGPCRQDAVESSAALHLLYEFPTRRLPSSWGDLWTQSSTSFSGVVQPDLFRVLVSWSCEFSAVLRFFGDRNEETILYFLSRFQCGLQIPEEGGEKHCGHQSRSRNLLLDLTPKQWKIYWKSYNKLKLKE